jgi:hypothetical protein
MGAKGFSLKISRVHDVVTCFSSFVDCAGLQCKADHRAERFCRELEPFPRAFDINPTVVRCIKAWTMKSRNAHAPQEVELRLSQSPP